jgi:hypothetical protein
LGAQRKQGIAIYDRKHRLFIQEPLSALGRPQYRQAAAAAVHLDLLLVRELCYDAFASDAGLVAEVALGLGRVEQIVERLCDLPEDVHF